ncbi:MAG: M81 family metallopeptidase [Chloroflexi bacterium]|jgi:microcystin degradation protein MlrC|nr:M81 family metallopeptidase [Chloroflexota bacterium]MDA1283121.1 M81 family metallopeptidase [Chloroflexota bacterium]
MRFAILGISHETNTFSKVPATYEEFEKATIARGQEIVDLYAESQYTISGYLQGAEELGFEAVPLMYANTGPIGTITKDAYDRISGEMHQMLRDQGPWDGVLISNHGAAVSEEFPDMDAEFTRVVREIVGPDVPVGVTLDMHANISKDTVANTDVCIVWRTCPHLDTKLRGRKTAELIYRTVLGEIKPTQFIEMPPMLVNIVKQFTGQEPMLSLVDECVAANEIENVLDTSIAEGYPYADVAEMGMSWITITDGDAELAEKTSKDLAARAWTRRVDLNKPVASIPDALTQAEELYVGPKPEGVENFMPSDGTALAEPEKNEHSHLGPIVLMDVGDNIGGGSSADSTHILKVAKEMGVTGYLQSLYDPEAVEACVVAGIGAELALDVGGKTDDMHGEPVHIVGTVAVIDDGPYEETRPTHGGYRFYDDGKRVLFNTVDGMTILLTSARSGNTARAQMYSMGINPEDYRIIVAKGVSSPRPAYQPIAAEIIIVNSPGVTSADLDTFEFKNRRVPLYPFEEPVYPA